MSTGGFFLYWETIAAWPTKRVCDTGEAIFQLRKAQPFRMTIDSKIGTIFFILLTGLVVSFSVLVAEYGKYNLLEPCLALLHMLASLRKTKIKQSEELRFSGKTKF